MPPGPIDALQGDINKLAGQVVLVPTTSADWQGSEEGSSRSDWVPKRLGANPPSSLVDLRSQTAEHVLAACGVPPALLGRSDGTLARESFRQMIHGAVRPVAALIVEQLAEKLDTPGLAFSFESLQASDISGRARAFGSLVQAGMDPAQAEIVAGLREL